MMREQNQFIRTVSPLTPAAEPAVGVYLTGEPHLCDSPRSLRPKTFASLTKKLLKLHIVTKTLED